MQQENLTPVLYYLCSGTAYNVTAGQETSRQAVVQREYIELHTEESKGVYSPVIRFNTREFAAFINHGALSHYLKATAELIEHFGVHHANISTMMRMQQQQQQQPKYTPFTGKYIVATRQESGWRITWTREEDGLVIPMWFDTIDEAEQEIKNNSEPDERSDFRIWKADMTDTGIVTLHGGLDSFKQFYCKEYFS
jgi:hypothetical protein